MRAVATTATKLSTENGADDAPALKQLAKQAGEAAQLLKLLGHEKRLLVLCFLAARSEETEHQQALLVTEQFEQLRGLAGLLCQFLQYRRVIGAIAGG